MKVLTTQQSIKNKLKMQSQRLIKFKLYYKNQVFGYEWLDETGWHYYTIELDTDLEDKVLRTHRGVVPHYFTDDKDLFRAEFTGLKDKNGIEIYEGDTLLDDHLDEKYQEKYIAQYQQNPWSGEFRMKNLTKDWNHGGVIREYLTVIGNKFENPELLNEKV